MTDIFISYASADVERARRLAMALEERGWSVWWDRSIPPGRAFDEVIEEALTGSQCVVVLWTDKSIESNWVKTEASDAMTRRILVPVLLDEVTIPFEFRRIQAARLTDWTGESHHPQFVRFVEAIAEVLGRPPKPTPEPRQQPQQPREKPQFQAANIGGFAQPQPGGGMGVQPSAQNIQNNLVKAILVTVFCCLPLGVVAIINAAQVSGKIAAGQYDDARRLAQEANKWSNWGLIAGVIGLVFYLLIIILSAIGGGF